MALVDPANSAFAITPSDSLSLATPTRGIYVGTNGNVSVQMVELGTAIVFVNVVAGTLLPIRVTRVNSTGTTSTNIIGLI